MKNNISAYITLHVVVVAVFLALEKYFIEKPLETTWKIDHFGSLRQFKPLSGSTGIGISERSDLVTIDIPSGKILNSIDLSKTDSDAYFPLESQRVDTLLVTYSSKSSDVYVFEKYSGKYIDKIHLDASPIFFGEFYQNGLLILDSNGKLTAWNGNLQKQVGTYDVKNFKASIYDGLLYVALGANIICLNDQGENIVANLWLSSDVLALRNGLAISKDEILNLRSNVKTSFRVEGFSAFGKLEAFSESIIAVFESERFTLYKVDDGDLKLLTQHAARHALNIETLIANEKTFVVSSSENELEIHDFSTFIQTEKLEDIKSYEKVLHNPREKASYFLSTDGEVIHQVVVGQDEVTVSSMPLASGKIESSTHRIKESVPRSKAALLNLPRSDTEIAKTHDLAEESHVHSLMLRLFLKIKHHVAQFGRFYMKLLTGKAFKSISEEDTYGFQKLLVTFDDSSKTLSAKNTRDGVIMWETKVEDIDTILSIESVNDDIYILSPLTVVRISARNGAIEHVEQFPSRAERFVKLAVDLPSELEEEGFEPYALFVKSGARLHPLEDKSISSEQYFADEENNKLRGYKIVDGTLVPTWEFTLSGERILGWTKNEDQLTSAAGIAKARRSVLYKYLNPNLITVLTANGDSKISVYLLDGITGSVLHVQRHDDDNIDLASVNVVQHDNWVFYSYFVEGDHLEQRVTVLDLFGTKANAKGGERSAFSDFDTSIHEVSSKTYIFPEKIVALASTATKHGITVKSIIALTELGSLVEIPKFLFNSRRVDDRALTPGDAEEFKMMPYEPVVGKPDLQVLNGNWKIPVPQKAGSLLIHPTEMESSCVVCHVNEASEFCTIVQPSSSYDILKSGFDKHKLLLTIGLLYTAYISTKPFVSQKKLNAKWLD